MVGKNVELGNEFCEEFINPVRVSGGYPAFRVANNEGSDPLTSGCRRLTFIGHEDLVILSMLCVDGWSSIRAEPQPCLVELHAQITRSVRFD